MISQNIVKIGLLVFLVVAVVPPVVLADYSVKERFSKIENDISEIRRDELNYRIEKELMKENFATNYQTILVVTSFLSILFTVLSVFGVRGIRDIQKEFESTRDTCQKELNGLRNIKNNLEAEIEKITLASNKQASLIKLLELNDKAQEHFAGARYEAALDYFNTITKLQEELRLPQDDRILSKKALCLSRMGRIKDGLDLIRQAYQRNATNDNALNLAEFLLLERVMPEYHDLIGKIQFSSLELKHYFDALTYYQDGDIVKMTEVMRQFLSTIPETGRSMVRQWINWDFHDLGVFLRITTPRPSAHADLLWAFALVLSGKAAPKVLVPLLGK